jgi:hypothetical protein
MSIEYPDILGDLVDAKQRFEVNGVHYVMALQPATIAPGQTAYLHVWLQNCWDMPVVVAITLHLPAHPPSVLSMIQAQTDVPLEAAEVGKVTIPLASGGRGAPGEYPISVTIDVRYEQRGFHIRSQQNSGQLGDTPLAFTTGLNLAAVLGLGFVARTCPQQQLRLRVEGPPQPSPASDLTPTFISHWTVADLALQGKAQQYVNDQRLHLLPKLIRQPLYLAFMEESQARFHDAALPLQIGEAIYLAKILTYSAEYFLSRSDRQDAVLVPAYSLALRYNMPVSDPITLIARADYGRMIRLAESISFGLLRQRLGRAPWTLEEQLAVTDLVANRVEQGGNLPAEFLYLALVLGGLLVAPQVQMPGESQSHSLSLLAKSYSQRTAELADNPELVAIFTQLLRSSQAGPQDG